MSGDFNKFKVQLEMVTMSIALIQVKDMFVLI
jgi:hypothetical protein